MAGVGGRRAGGGAWPLSPRAVQVSRHPAPLRAAAGVRGSGPVPGRRRRHPRAALPRGGAAVRADRAPRLPAVRPPRWAAPFLCTPASLPSLPPAPPPSVSAFLASSRRGRARRLRPKPADPQGRPDGESGREDVRSRVPRGEDRGRSCPVRTPSPIPHPPSPRGLTESKSNQRPSLIWFLKERRHPLRLRGPGRPLWVRCPGRGEPRREAGRRPCLR